MSADYRQLWRTSDRWRATYLQAIEDALLLLESGDADAATTLLEESIDEDNAPVVERSEPKTP